jgi:SAM-dependent methyltransferase
VFAILRDDDHKSLQAGRSLDDMEEAWEIERPHGAPLLYGWLMCEKFRRSIEGIEDGIGGEVALVACAGSGMDAEFLARRGAHVIVADLSLSAVQRARERGLRQNIPLAAIVADVEALPFPDRAVGMTYVHDGLHHLRDPYVGLREMARVAARAVSINEPARALVTKMAILAGIASEHEEPGNRVERLDPDLVQLLLRQAGLTVIGADRYAMFYRHAPGLAMHLLSRSRLFPITRTAIESFNNVLGDISNKLAVRAVRNAPQDR